MEKLKRNIMRVVNSRTKSSDAVYRVQYRIVYCETDEVEVQKK